MQEGKIKIIKHVKRLQGQLNSVLLELEKENTDCIKASNTLFASSRSFASFRLEFIKCFLEKDFINSKKIKSEDKKFASLLSIIKG